MTPVLEFEEQFGFFHLAAELATEAVCGRKGSLSRLLPADSWEGAPGPFPATFCRRCAAAPGRYEVPTRALQLQGIELEIQARATGRGPAWLEAERWLYSKKWKTGQAGVGYVTLEDERQRIFWNERCEGVTLCGADGAALRAS